MRCIPTALAVTDQIRRIRESMDLSAITHDDPRCTVACAAYNEIAAALLAGTVADTAVTIGQATATRLHQPAVADAIGSGQQLRPAMPALTAQTFLADDAAGFVLDSLSLAVAAVLDARPLTDVLVDIVRIGNDTDAAIAGGLLGVHDGAAAIPAAWLSMLQYTDEFITAADTLRNE